MFRIGAIINFFSFFPVEAIHLKGRTSSKRLNDYLCKLVIDPTKKDGKYSINVNIQMFNVPNEVILHRVSENASKALNTRMMVDVNGNPDLYKIMEKIHDLFKRQYGKNTDYNKDFSMATPRLYPASTRFKAPCYHEVCDAAYKKLEQENRRSVFGRLLINTLESSPATRCCKRLYILDDGSRFIDESKSVVTQVSDVLNYARSLGADDAYFFKLNEDADFSKMLPILYCHITQIVLTFSTFMDKPHVDYYIIYNELILDGNAQTASFQKVPDALDWDDDNFTATPPPSVAAADAVSPIPSDDEDVSDSVLDQMRDRLKRKNSSDDEYDEVNSAKTQRFF